MIRMSRHWSLWNSFALATTALASFLAAPLTAAEQPAQFTRQPAIERDGDAYRVVFGVDRATDCTVAILDERGRVVRHLASGVLGEKAPAPFRRGAFEQSLNWDGRDDFGQAVSGQSFRARVSLGLKPKLEKLIGDNPGRIGFMISGMTVSPQGELFILHSYGFIHYSDATTVCSVYDRQGNYVRTIVPYPATMPQDKLAGIRRVDYGDGHWAPFYYQGETRSVMPGIGTLPTQDPVATSDGCLAIVGLKEVGTYNQPGTVQLLSLRQDGSVPEGGLERAILTKNTNRGASLALAPDERTLYVTGLYSGRSPDHAVHRLGRNDATPQVFLGRSEEAASGAAGFNEPVAVATDAEGRLYVADRGNDRIAIFDQQGKHLRDIAVEKPQRLRVASGTGGIYVIAGEKAEWLLKYENRSAEKPLDRFRLHPYAGVERNVPLLAVDGTSSRTVVWVAAPSAWSRYRLLRIEETGGRFGEPTDLNELPGNAKPAAGRRESFPTAGEVMGMALDRENRLLYLNNSLYDLETGEWSEGLMAAAGSKRGTGSFGWDGKFYSMGYSRWLARYDHERLQIPFQKNSDDKGTFISPLGGSNRLRARGVTADVHGNVFALFHKSQDEGVGHSTPTVLCRIAPDGEIFDEALIDTDIRGVDSVRLDPAGNIYVAAALRPGTQRLPDFLDGKVPADEKAPGAIDDINFYPLMYGSILKFSPKGGRIKDGKEHDAGIECNYGYGVPLRVEGAEWIFSGVSSVPSFKTSKMEVTRKLCGCEGIRFDVDHYGRSVFPDSLGARVGILDTAGNLICWFGSYGNQDSAGPESKIPTPEIPFWWPHLVCVDEGGAFIADRLNRRVVQVSWTFAVEVESNSVSTAE